MLTVMALNMEMLTLAPQYTAYGSQQYEYNGTTYQCSPAALQDYNITTCHLTQLAQFQEGIMSRMSYFAFFFTWSNFALVAISLVSMVIAAVRSRRANTHVDEEDLFDD